MERALACVEVCLPLATSTSFISAAGLQ